MTRTPFDKVSVLYDFVEKYILKDYQGSLDIIQKHLMLNEQEIILDVGGGTGYITKAIQRPNDTIVILDPAHRMLQKIHTPSISIVQADGSKAPFHDNIFSLAIFVNTLHHIPEQNHKLVLQETYRVLQKNGRIFLIDVWYPKRLSIHLFTKFEEFMVGTTYHRSPEDLQKMLSDVGFHEVTTLFPQQHGWKYIALGKKL